MRSLRSVLTDTYSWFMLIGMFGGFAEGLILLAAFTVCPWAWLLIFPLAIILIVTCVWLDEISFKRVLGGLLDFVREVKDEN